MAFQGKPDSATPEGSSASLARLEGRLEETVALLRRLEARVEALEGTSEMGTSSSQVTLPHTEPEPSGLLEGVSIPDPASATLILGLLGQVFLVLAGAFFIRALTDGGKLPSSAGVFIGLAYAAAWALVADRAGKSGKSPAAVLFSLSSAGIAFPLIWEATTKFAVFSPAGAAAAILSMASLLMAVAWRRELHSIAWVVILTTLATGFALMVATSAVQTFTTAFLVLGPAVLWLTYGRRWRGLRWPTALAADASVLILGTLVAWPGGPPETYRGFSAPFAFVQSLGLLVLYLGSFLLRTLQRNRAVILFEGIQTCPSGWRA
jgi:hypothetical protein